MPVTAVARACTGFGQWFRAQASRRNTTGAKKCENNFYNTDFSLGNGFRDENWNRRLQRVRPLERPRLDNGGTFHGSPTRAPFRFVGRRARRQLVPSEEVKKRVGQQSRHGWCRSQDRTACKPRESFGPRCQGPQTLPAGKGHKLVHTHQADERTHHERSQRHCEQCPVERSRRKASFNKQRHKNSSQDEEEQ